MRYQLQIANNNGQNIIEIVGYATRDLLGPLGLGLVGLMIACLMAALMSTVDTLITAVSAVAVNDLYRPYVNPKANDRQLLRVARISAVTVTLIGLHIRHLAPLH